MSNAFENLMQSENLDQLATTSSGGGRQMHDYWFGYTKVYSEGKILAKCNNCMKTISNTAKSRMEKHRAICCTGNIDEHENVYNITVNENFHIDKMKFATDAVGNELQSIINVNEDLQPNPRSTLRPIPNMNQSFDSQDSLEFKCPSPKQQKMEWFLDNMLPAESDEIDSLIAEFFYACNIPFWVVDSIYFRKLVKTLRPAYNPPQRHLLEEKLLNNTHDKIEIRNSELISQMDKRMTLLVDGLENTSANRHYIIMNLATSNDQKVFLESFDFSATQETGANQVFLFIEKSIALAEERYGAKVYTVLTDNADNMQNMGANCQSLGVLYCTCNAYSANLLAGDILKSPAYKKIMKEVKSVEKYFKGMGLVNSLSNVGVNKPISSCATSWTRQRDSAEYLIQNLSAMKTAVCNVEGEIDEKSIKPKNEVCELLFNDDFLASVRNLLEILNSVVQLMNICQKSTTSAADASENWLILLNDGPSDMRPFLEYRLKESNVLNIITMTANYLHPVYRGKRLKDDQLKDVKHYIFEKLEADELESFRQFTVNEGVFDSLNRKNITLEKTFWHFAGELGHQNLAAFATDYLKIPASTAQLQRLFANWTSVHNATRNRLSDETSKKLMDIYFTLRSFDEIPDDENGSDIDSDDEV